MGDQDAIDCEPPDVGYQVDPGWSMVHGYFEVAANWVLIRENMLDLTHIAFLHKNTFKQDDWITAPDTYMEGETVCYEQEFELAPLSPLFCAGMGLAEDKHLLEKLQASVAADPRGLDFLEVTLGADGAGIKVRQILNKKLAAEGQPL